MSEVLEVGKQIFTTQTHSCDKRWAKNGGLDESHDQVDKSPEKAAPLLWRRFDMH